MSAEDYRVVGSETLYRGAILSLRRDRLRMSDGSEADREVVEHIGAVAIAAIDDLGRILLVNQYRHPVGERLDELPAGLLDEDGERAVDAAARELLEETRMRAKRWDLLLDVFPSPGFSTEAIRIYLARDLEPVEDSDFVAEHEEMTMTVTAVDLDEAVRRTLDGRIRNGPAVAGILAAARARDAGWAGLRSPDEAWPARPGR